MTITIDAPAEIESDDMDDNDQSQDSMSSPDNKKKRERDFSKFRPSHQELADFVNANSGLSPVTPNQVKAILALRVDFNNLPDQISKREERRRERAAAKTRYDGMTPDQVKAAKAAERAERQAAKLEARVAEAKAKAEALRSSAAASGEDLAAAVEAAQAEEPTASRPRIGRRK